jgi:hypothetical protein
MYEFLIFYKNIRFIISIKIYQKHVQQAKNGEIHF